MLTLQFEDYTSSSNYARESFKSAIFSISNSKPATDGIKLIYIGQQRPTVLRAALLEVLLMVGRDDLSGHSQP